MSISEKGKGRGFASMSAEKRRAVSSKGGKRAHELGTCYRWDSEGARKAGKIGGSISRRGPARRENDGS